MNVNKWIKLSHIGAKWVSHPPRATNYEACNTTRFIHNSERISLIENVYPMIQLDGKSVPSTDFKSVVNSKNKDVLQTLGCFLHTGFKKRDEISHIWIVFSCIY